MSLISWQFVYLLKNLKFIKKANFSLKNNKQKCSQLILITCFKNLKKFKRLNIDEALYWFLVNFVLNYLQILHTFSDKY